MRVHYEMEVRSLQPIAGKVLEYLVYLPFAGNLSHFSRSVLYVSVDD